MPPGRPRTPTAILELTGSWRAKQRRSEGEPRPAASAPERPAWIKGRARKEWDRLVPELLALGVLATIDRDALAIYCETLVDLQIIRKRIAKEGLTIKDDRGSIKKNPATQLYREACERTLIFAREFGLTPSSRSRIRIEQDPQAEESLEDFERRKDSPPGQGVAGA